ncbi:alpha-N-acetylglucosaminidase TIM-barrel domain-containing protein [Fodinicola acaciae]|uniref:alpha-N-acetylglucosaminidase TIM-barrel domain-containing protein n=1 Tax=Fodinicola acaciae TaxID=2681555 RepID=UPI0013D02CEE|nr:alpha-N-acetylglucosaminidase TIM-barrel domain-containing protein [Fodinicola acaciae]
MRARSAVIALFLLLCLAPAPATAASPAGPAARALARLVGAWHASQVDFRPMAKSNGKDVFRISTSYGRLVVAGSTPAVQLTGFGWYLQHVVHASVSLEGSQLRLPARLPLPVAPVEHAAVVANRFALNDTNEGYANPYLSWQQWQHRIDVLALLGINEVLVYEGQEAVYQRAFQQFHYTAAEMRGWIPQPGHQPWWLLQNMCCVSSPISQQLIDRRTVLGRRIADHLRELGMTPVFPGYYGTVPPRFAEKNPGARTVPQGTWAGLERPDWLDPTNPFFAKVAAAFYRAQTQLFGASAMYKMDLLHEGGTAGPVDVAAASKAVQQALETAHPGAIWAILGWQSNPRQDTLKAVDRSKMLIVDGLSEQANVTDRDRDFLGTPYAFGTIWNFGGHANLGASLAAWNQKFHAWLAKPGSAMNGIALMPEAIDNNPAAVAFFADLAWQPAAVDLDAWFDDYATSRYGGVDAHARAAWRILENTVYSIPPETTTKYPTALYDDEPSLTDTGSPLGYDPDTFASALTELLQVAPELRASSAYRYDLVDVGRQALANDSRVLLPKIRSAYAARDLTTFRQLTAQWNQRVQLMDKLLGTDPNFLFGSWLSDARAQASSPQEAATLNYDVRSLVTLWASETDLQDYARREWNGLVGDYYANRWKKYFASLEGALTSGQPPAKIDWHAVAEQWSRSSTRYPDRPHGDAYALASQVADIPSGALSLTATPKGVAPGGSVRLTATFQNQSQLRAARRVQLKIAAPAGYAVTPVTPTSQDVPVGGTFAASWTITVPADAKAAATPTITGSASWTSGQQVASESALTHLLVTGDLGQPYATVSHNDAGFAQSADGFLIAGGGADLWLDRNEFGSIYRKQALTDGQAAMTRVTAQENTSPYARAGLIASNDLAGGLSGGYANIAVTPERGCVFSWDSDGNGTLDKHLEAGGFTAPAYVRLGRSGDQMSGSCSSDGKNWTVVGVATVPGGAAAEDVGMFMSAVNADTRQTGIAQFSGIDLGPYAPLPTTPATVVSLKKPVTALSEEAGNPAAAANDGSRSNYPYWGSRLESDGTWWQVDLGTVSDVSNVNIRNYVDGRRFYTYQVLGSLDGKVYFVIGGKENTDPATDAGDTFRTEAHARYVKVVGLGNSANSSFHLTEVTVSAR